MVPFHNQNAKERLNLTIQTVVDPLPQMAHGTELQFVLSYRSLLCLLSGVFTNASLRGTRQIANAHLFFGKCHVDAVIFAVFSLTSSADLISGNA